MAVELNRTSFKYAKELVTQGRVVVDQRDAWSEHQPSTQEEHEFSDAHGYAEYAKWHLGIDDEQDESTTHLMARVMKACRPKCTHVKATEMVDERLTQALKCFGTHSHAEVCAPEY